MSKVIFRIDLEYNQTDFEFMVGEVFDSEASFIEAAADYAVQDLVALWREHDDVRVFAETIIEDEEDV